MDTPWPLPASWRWHRFDEVAHVASDLVDPADYLDMPHIAPNHIESETGRLLPHTTIRSDGMTSPKHRFVRGQVLYSKIRPYLAKVVVAEFDGLCSADMYPIESELESRYLKWWMLTREFTRRAAGEQARTVLPKINKRSLAKLPVPVPLVEEQRRIVDILEDHLSRVDAAKVSTSTAARRVSALRSSVIARGLRDAGGEVRSLDQIITRLRNGIFVSRPGTAPNGVPILRIGAVRPLALDLSDLRYSERDSESLAADDSLLDPGDLLFTRYNGNPRFVGACAVVPGEVGALTYPDKLIRVVVNRDVAVPDFVALACSVGPGREQIQQRVKTTSGQAGISGRDLRRVEVRVPSLAAQEAMVRRVHAELDLANRLVDELAILARRAGTLRRALLQSAFTGRLTGSSSDIEIVEEMAGV
jgi:type I restriction enzyme, S subunit